LVFAGKKKQPEKTKRVILLPTPQNENIVNKVNENIELKKLADIENLSVRATHTCENASLYCLGDIINFYNKYGGFTKIRNCGKNTNAELINICKKYPNAINNYTKNTENNEAKQGKVLFDNTEHKRLNQIHKLTDSEFVVLNNLIKEKLDTLSNRAENALLVFLKYDITIYNIKKRIYNNKDFDVKNIKNVGTKTAKEIEVFLIELIQTINNIRNLEHKDISIETAKATIAKRFKLNDKDFHNIGIVGNDQEYIPVFTLLNYLIENNYIYSKKYSIVFNNISVFWQNRETRTLSEIGKELNLTRERVRQIRSTILSHFYKTFNFLKFFKDNCINRYRIDLKENLINIDLDEITMLENVDFSKQFVNLIIHIIIRDKFSLIGSEFNLTGIKKRKEYKWQSSYLINKSLTQLFDFDKMVLDINRRISEKITESYELNFQAYLLNFFKKDDKIHLDDVTNIAEQILYNEFEITIDSEDNIKFLKNSLKSIPDYIYSTLKVANKPLTIYEIFDILDQQYHGISKSAEALRGSCQRDNRLIYFGRSSTYGLKIWEEKFDNIRGGTMHDISEEYLLKFDEPKHINEIAEYVKSFRKNVTAKNLFYNLKSAEHRRFVFFQNSLIGLASKSYNIDLFPTVPKYYSNKKSWEENFQLLEIFTSKNDRLPNSLGNDDEIRLYRFFSIQVRKLSELADTKKELIENLMLKYNFQKRIRHNNKKWDKLYDKLFSFVQAHGRAPSMQIYSERKLYGFFYRQRNLYKEKKLSNEYLSRFLEITKIIKNFVR